MSQAAGRGEEATSVVLVGFMGAGKSTVGRALAERCGVTFVDCDELIAAQAGPIDEIFATRGEAGFRALECEVVLSALTQAGKRAAVIALGGGAVTIPEVREALGRTPHVVWLEAPVDELWQRVGEGEGGARPLARDPDAFRRLYEQRASLYEEVAGLRVRCDGSRTVEDVVEDLVRQTGLCLGQRGDGKPPDQSSPGDAPTAAGGAR
jgi:shikimate kinase